MRSPTKFNRYDALLALCIALFALALLAHQAAPSAGRALTLTVTSDGAVIASGALDAMQGAHTYQSGGYTVVVAVDGGRVSVTESNCPNGDCVRSGAISRAGESIVCLPARLSVTLSGGDGSYDLIVG